jgi:dTMP kinase
MSKVPDSERDEYIEWCEDYEYNRLCVPRPDIVIYLDMPPAVSQKLMSGRYNGDESKKDIHEKDVDYLNSCRKAADYSCKKLGWTRIVCAENGEPLPIDLIAEKVFAAVSEAIGI